MKKILILINHDGWLYNLRRELVEALLARGDEVYISCPYGEKIQYFTDKGVKCYDVALNRHGTNPLAELKLLKTYKSLIKEIKPDVVLTYTIKPVVYGGMACSSAKVKYIANITGLGTAMENGGILGIITRILYKAGVKKASCVFFQNERNRDVFISERLYGGKNRLLPGSGVNLEQHRYMAYPKEDTVRFLFVGRLMRDKGVGELLQAAEALRKKYSNISIELVGAIDDSFGEIINKYEKDGIVTYHGQQSDVRPFYANAHCVVLPSYHEGMANVLLEAAATGRPVIATDVAGCRETFDDGVSGISCKVTDAESLLQAMERFMEMDIESREQMGLAGRQKVEKEFDRQIVVDSYLEEIDDGISRADKE